MLGSVQKTYAQTAGQRFAQIYADDVLPRTSDATFKSDQKYAKLIKDADKAFVVAPKPSLSPEMVEIWMTAARALFLGIVKTRRNLTN